MARLFRAHPQAVARTMEIVERCGFSLDELAYEYPDEPIPPGLTPDAAPGRSDLEGCGVRAIPQGIPRHGPRQLSRRNCG